SSGRLRRQRSITVHRGSGTEPGRRGSSLRWRCSTSRAVAPANGGRPVTSSYSRIDRKSTRLNSRHLGISYAVFCLKKKKNILIRRTQIITHISLTLVLLSNLANLKIDRAKTTHELHSSNILIKLSLLTTHLSDNII